MDGNSLERKKYAAYLEYKDSNVIWIGSYPESWSLTRVKFEAYVKARVGWHGLKSDDFTDEGPYLVTGSDFRGSRIEWENCYHCDEARYEQDPYIQLKEGDLLLTKDGTIGKVALVEGLNNEKATLNSGVFVVRPTHDNFSTRFYYWLLQSKVFTDFVDYNKTGSTIVHLYQDTFVNFSYAAPTSDEEIQIACFLDHETAKIDTLIEEQQSLIRLLKEKRQAVISHAITKGLNPDAPMKDSGVEWLGEVPEHWIPMQVRRILCDMEQGKSPECENREAISDQWGVLKTSCVNNGSYNYRENKALPENIEPFIQYEVKAGDVLMSRASGSVNLIGSVAYVYETEPKILLSDKIFRLHFHDKINCLFFTYLMNSTYMRKNIEQAISGAEGMANNITKSAVMGFHFALPPIDEQHQIVNHLREINAKFDKLIEEAELIVSVSMERRTALISAAVTGKIDVRDWQPEAQQQEQPAEATV
ncbi:restriction endonuclease subunit S [Endozoicomonas sp. SESOKO2]|uniref:restriction endonuclease subunit S n=1 Tax=Endozoicomonas sp. SESOKO2 TaxID=2828743 RepID=UPI002147F226|nr:restriction endonuclease subunit S [Endozoicomonas sp. SESOKO2]